MSSDASSRASGSLSSSSPPQCDALAGFNLGDDKPQRRLWREPPPPLSKLPSNQQNPQQAKRTYPNFSAANYVRRGDEVPEDSLEEKLSVERWCQCNHIHPNGYLALMAIPVRKRRAAMQTCGFDGRTRNPTAVLIAKIRKVQGITAQWETPRVPEQEQGSPQQLQHHTAQLTAAQRQLRRQTKPVPQAPVTAVLPMRKPQKRPATAQQQQWSPPSSAAAAAPSLLPPTDTLFQLQQPQVPCVQQQNSGLQFGLDAVNLGMLGVQPMSVEQLQSALDVGMIGQVRQTQPQLRAEPTLEEMAAMLRGDISAQLPSTTLPVLPTQSILEQQLLLQTMQMQQQQQLQMLQLQQQQQQLLEQQRESVGLTDDAMLAAAVKDMLQQEQQKMQLPAQVSLADTARVAAMLQQLSLDSQSETDKAVWGATPTSPAS